MIKNKKDEKIFPVLDTIYTTQPETLDSIIFGESKDIDLSDLPLVLIDSNTIIIPITTFKGYCEIGADVLISHCFLSKTTIKSGSKILDSRIFTAVLNEESVIIASTIEGSKIGKRCYLNNSILTESVLEDEVTICGNSSVNKAKVSKGVIICPQVVVENSKIEDFCYLESGVKLIGQKGKYGINCILLKKKVYVGPNVLIVDPALIEHNSYIEAGVEIDAGSINSNGLFISPFSYIRKSCNKNGFEILQNRSFYLCDGLWYVSKSEPVEIGLIREIKNKLSFIEIEGRKRKLDLREILTEKNVKTGGLPPVQLLLESEALKNFNIFLQQIMQSLVN